MDRTPLERELIEVLVLVLRELHRVPDTYVDASVVGLASAMIAKVAGH